MAMTSAPLDAVANEPISYDDHGDIPFNVPFTAIPPDAISIYLQLDTRVGRATCQQTCAHCFFINQPAARARSVDLAEGRRMMDGLASRGYRIFPMIADSFAGSGEFLEIFGNTHIRDYRQEADRRLTKTMRRGEMWSSGAPLLRDDWRALLQRGVDNGFGSVTMTFHGMLDEQLALAPHETYPIAGVFPGARCLDVIGRITRFNDELAQCGRVDERLQVNIGITIGRHNHSRAMLRRYLECFNALTVDVVRFNCFHDHGQRHPHLTLTPAQVAAVYRDLKELHATIPLAFQIGIDEDFGTSGIEVMGFPAHTGYCRAGRQLFAAVPEPPSILREDGVQKVERVGTVAACVDAFQPIVGYVLRQTDGTMGVTYDIAFLVDVIDDLNAKRTNGTYQDGCYAGEMLAKSSAP
jgi:hypothetical protein